MLTLLARLGLRAGEVAARSLDDIDWRAGEVTVTGKSRRIERLPLPTDARPAVAAYLRDSRPAPNQFWEWAIRQTGLSHDRLCRTSGGN